MGVAALKPIVPAVRARASRAPGHQADFQHEGHVAAPGHPERGPPQGSPYGGSPDDLFKTARYRAMKLTRFRGHRTVCVQGVHDGQDVIWRGIRPIATSRVRCKACVSDRASRLVLAGHHGYDPCDVWGERDAVPGMWINSRQGTTGAHRAGLPPVSLPVWEAVQRAQHRLVEPDAISE